MFVRHARPSVVVGTGVRGGLRSAYLPAALDANEEGRLISIDIGDASILPDDIAPPPQPGWIVSERLRPRWELRIGDSEEHLRAVLPEHDVGVFLSDVPNASLGSDLSAAKHHLDPGGLVVTCLPTDSDARTTWREFAVDGIESHVVGGRWRDGGGSSDLVVGPIE